MQWIKETLKLKTNCCYVPFTSPGDPSLMPMEEWKSCRMVEKIFLP